METAPTPISSDELARDLPGVLRRVRKHGERFAVTCDGETAAELLPACNFPSPEEVAAKLEGLEWPDEEFASDAAWVKENQPRTPSGAVRSSSPGYLPQRLRRLRATHAHAEGSYRVNWGLRCLMRASMLPLHSVSA